MGDIADAFESAFRAYNTDGVPASGPYKPAKAEIRAIGDLIETVIPFSIKPEAYGATGDGSADDTVAIANALAAVPAGGRLFLTPGKVYRISSLLNVNGTEFEGGGQLVIGAGSAAYSLTNYATGLDYVAGRGNLYRLYDRINSTGTTLNITLFGDSRSARGSMTFTGAISGTTLTVSNAGTATLEIGTILTSVSGSPTITAYGTGTGGTGTYTISASTSLGSTTITASNGGGYAGAAGEPQVLLARLLRQNGVPNTINIRNRAIGGKTVGDFNPTIDLSASWDGSIIAYSTNHFSAQSVDLEIDKLDDQVAAIRAATYGAWNLHFIVLVLPYAAHDTSGGRTSFWNQRLRQGYEEVARKYDCFLIDLNWLFPDATRFAGYYGDTPFIHGSGLLTQQVLAYIADTLIPPGAIELSVTTDWVSCTGQNSWANYGSGNNDFQVCRLRDGKKFLRGAISRASGTPTAGQDFGLLPNQNYYPSKASGGTGWTYNGSVWTALPVIVQTDGSIEPASNTANNTLVRLDGIWWD